MVLSTTQDSNKQYSSKFIRQSYEFFEYLDRIDEGRGSNKTVIKEFPFKIAAMNVRGISNKAKSIEGILIDQDIDILIISEIGTRNMPKFTGYTKFVNYKKKHKHMNGIAILVRKNLRELCHRHKSYVLSFYFSIWKVDWKNFEKI